MNTTYFLNLVAGNVFKTKTNPVIPTKLFLGLSRSEPRLDMSNVDEPSAAAGYARVQISGLSGSTTTYLSTPTNGVVTNTRAIDFAESTSGWGVMTHFVIYDAATGGNLLMYGKLTENRTVEAATVMTIKTNSLTLSAVNPT